VYGEAAAEEAEVTGDVRCSGSCRHHPVVKVVTTW
jgi:hypothetical protein